MRGNAVDRNQTTRHMKFSVSSAELLRSVLTVQKAIPSKAAEAILEDYLFELEGTTLTITASDTEITLRTVLQVADVEQEGRIAVAAKQLTELLKELPDQPLTISNMNENSFSCAWASGESVLPCFNPDDYPVIKSAGGEAWSISLSSQTLAEGIADTVYASSDDDNRPNMNSIFFDIKPDGTTLVASDLQKLICFRTKAVKAACDCSFLLNKRHANVVKSILGKEDEEVKVVFDSKYAEFSFAQTTAICCLVSGKYPDYNSIIPKNNTNVLTISRTQFLNSVRRITVCSPKASNHVKFEMTAGSIEISAQDLGLEIAAHEKVSCSYEGDDLSIGFRANHIIEILSNLSCENVIIRFADKRRSALILPDGDEDAVNKVFGIVMPIMVK